MITNPFTGLTLNFPPQARAKSLEVRRRKAAAKKAREQSGQRAKFRGAASPEEALAQKLAEMKAIKARDAHERPLASFMRGERSEGPLAVDRVPEYSPPEVPAQPTVDKVAEYRRFLEAFVRGEVSAPPAPEQPKPQPKSKQPKSTGKLAPVHPGGKLPTERRRAIRAAQAGAIEEKLKSALAGMIKQKGKPDLEGVAHLGRKIKQAERIAKRATDRAEGVVPEEPLPDNTISSSGFSHLPTEGLNIRRHVRNRLFNPFTGQVVNAKVPNPRGCNQHTGPDCSGMSYSEIDIADVQKNNDRAFEELKKFGKKAVLQTGDGEYVMAAYPHTNVIHFTKDESEAKPMAREEALKAMQLAWRYKRKPLIRVKK